MNDSVSTASKEFVFRRMEEPLRLFGYSIHPSMYWVILGVLLAIGLFYISLMYRRDSKSIGWGWAGFLGFLRTCVYLILCGVFLLPAEQTWHESKSRSKVIAMFDVSLSMSTARDRIPEPGQTFLQMPTRTDGLIELLNSKEINFLGRLEERNPITAYRFSRGIDPDFLHFEKKAGELNFWPRSEREQIMAARSKDDRDQLLAQFPGRTPRKELWTSWLTPLQDNKLPAGWNKDDQHGLELLRQVKANEEKYKAKFFHATAVGESLLEVIKQERNNMVEGIILFTDGRLTEGSASAITDAARAAEDANIPIFVVQVGEVRPKVAIDIVDISVAPVIRPEDKFRVIVNVTGQDMPANEPFDIALDITRVGPDPADKEKEKNKPIELVELDEKGNIIMTEGTVDGKKAAVEKTLPLTNLEPHRITLPATFAKEKPVFKAGNPPSAQVEYELDAATLARAANKTLEPGKKYGVAPDEVAQFRFVARIPKDKREITDLKEHVSDKAEMRVLKRPMRVLLFASAATKDFQFLKNLLVREAEKGRAELSIHLQKLPGGEKRSGIVLDVDAKRMLDDFPTKRLATAADDNKYSALSEYDVVVTFDVNWNELSVDQTKLLSDWVEKDGGGLIFIAGQIQENTQEVASPLNSKDGTRFKPLIDMLPVVLEYSQKEEVTADVPHRLEFPQATAELEFMRLDESDPKADWKKGWQRFFDEIQDEDGKIETKPGKEEPERGIYSYYPIKKVKDNALRLAAIDSNKNMLRVKGPDGKDRFEKQPWLVSGPWGKGKVVYLGSGETWRLRMYKESYHERFWTKLLRDVGSQSINTLSRHITPTMSRYGVVNKIQPFEARFEDMNGAPLHINTAVTAKALLPRLVVTPPEGVQAQVKDTVIIKAGEFNNKRAKVIEIISGTDAAGAELRKLKLGSIEGAENPQQTVILESSKVDVVVDDLVFVPKNPPHPTDPGETARRNTNNNGVFRVEFQPKVAGDYRLKVIYEYRVGNQDNVYNHKFTVRDSNPEIDNVKPDLEVLWELASPAKKVLERVKNKSPQTADKLRAILKRPEGLVRKDGEKKPEAGADRPADEETMRLLFDMKNAEVIPDCMTKQDKSFRNRGKVEDQWDKGFFEYETEQGETKSRLPFVLALAVGLLSIEWLTRKLLRLA